MSNPFEIAELLQIISNVLRPEGRIPVSTDLKN